jgi:hypothetical protein
VGGGGVVVGRQVARVNMDRSRMISWFCIAEMTEKTLYILEMEAMLNM